MPREGSIREILRFFLKKERKGCFIVGSKNYQIIGALSPRSHLQRERGQGEAKILTD